MTRPLPFVFWIGLVIMASLAMYHTSDRVQNLTKELHQLNQDIESEKASLHILRADWVYLSNPTRIEHAAKHLLTLRPTSPQQFTGLTEFVEILPTRAEALASVAVSSKPIANVRTTLVGLPLDQRAFNNHSLAVHSTHLNDRMNMQRTASAAPLPDTIGSLISSMGSHP